VAATAPFCNVTVFAPPPGPSSPKGFRQLGPNSSMADVINTVNNNSSAQDLFNKLLQKFMDEMNTRIKNEMKKLRFVQTSIVRQKIKVENPQDRSQWVIDDRVKAMVMTDSRTGATWVWQDANAGRGVQAGTEETISGLG
jgi:hypothetical protein